MCGQFAVLGSIKQIKEYFEFLKNGDFILDDDDFYGFESALIKLPNEKVKPMAYMPIVAISTSMKIAIFPARWGLIPSWANDESIAYKTINARVETISEKPSFKSAFRQRRCLIPMSGFYERGSDKQLYYFSNKEDDFRSFAGLYEIWGKQNLITFTIVTKPADERVLPIHPRMPMVLDDDAAMRWLYGNYEL